MMSSPLFIRQVSALAGPFGERVVLVEFPIQVAV